MDYISYISVGSNLGNRVLNCKNAINKLNDFSRVLRVSSFYETEPWGYEDDNQYINVVLKLRTNLSVKKLLLALKLIEKNMGRFPTKNQCLYESRIIDLDILFFDNLIINDSNIVIPHPKLYDRNYVLQPFLEIDPGFVCPAINKTISMIHKLCEDRNQVYVYPH